MLSNIGQTLGTSNTNKITNNHNSTETSFGQGKLAYYSKQENIGKGAYGVVCRAIDTRTK